MAQTDENLFMQKWHMLRSYGRLLKKYYFKTKFWINEKLLYLKSALRKFHLPCLLILGHNPLNHLKNHLKNANIK